MFRSNCSGVRDGYSREWVGFYQQKGEKMVAYSLFILGMFLGAIIIPILIACDSHQSDEIDKKVLDAYESTSFMKR